MKIRIWLSFLLAALFAVNAPAQQKITINYPNRSGSNWPLFLAKDGGYYQKHGLDVTLTFRRDAGGSGDAGERRGADGEFVAGSIDAGGVQRWLAGAGGQFAQSRHIRADGRQEHRQHQGSEREAHRGLAGGRRALRLPDCAACRNPDCRRAMCNGSPWARM